MMKTAHPIDCDVSAPMIELYCSIKTCPRRNLEKIEHSFKTGTVTLSNFKICHRLIFSCFPLVFLKLGRWNMLQVLYVLWRVKSWHLLVCSSMGQLLRKLINSDLHSSSFVDKDRSWRWAGEPFSFWKASWGAPIHSKKIRPHCYRSRKLFV